MPVHHYVPLNPPCKLCGDGFDSLQPPHAPPLHECPRCGRPVARQPAAPSLPRLTAPLSKTTAKQNGFTILKRACDGNFEKQ